MGLESYYLFGLDIKLDKYGLGTIRQPRLRDFILRDDSLEMFYMPFLYVDMIVGKSKYKDEVRKIINENGAFNFLLKTCVETSNLSVLFVLQESFKFLYGTENVKFGEDADIVINDTIHINNDNFNVITDVVFEMLKVDRSKIKFDEDKDLYEGLSDEMLEAKRKFLERNKIKNKQEDTMTILDVANIVIHSKGVDYENVLNMTIYQLKNSFEVLNKKESFDISTLYRISPKFDMSKEKYEHWTEKIKIDKSRLVDNG